MFDYLSFKLPDDFVESYHDREVDWGFQIGAGNSLGEFNFLTKYSRRLDENDPNSAKERWYDTCRRCIEGYYSILKDHCLKNRTPWNEQKAQASAKKAFERMFTFKWLPPGRGLWMMGTRFVHERQESSALQNCAFVSTSKLSNHSAREATLPFVRLMEMSMLGVGVGFDTKGEGKLTINAPTEVIQRVVIADSREGWYESVALLLESYFFQNRPTIEFVYDDIRDAGQPIKGFGGVAAGPGPLRRLHENIRWMFVGREGEKITSTDIVDLMNFIGKCVVAGNVRRSAEIALGFPDDQDFLDLKNWEVNPTRMGADGWGGVSNNSIFAKVGMDMGNIADLVAANGEPGFLYLDLCQQYGRLVDPPNNRDHRARGTNPCGEQTLESYECCTLVETFPHRHEDLDDYKETLKHAYLYGKAVTLLPTHWPETNEVMQRNRRIGCSMSGVAQFVESRGWTELRTWANQGYQTVTERDELYSDWLGVRTSIKMTSIKPSGTVSILAGATPGAHWMPGGPHHIRRIRLRNNDPIVDFVIAAGYHVEPDVQDPTHSVVAEFPTQAPPIRSQREVSIWEKTQLAVILQRYWADNQVSVTLTFMPEEAAQIGSLIASHEGQLKSMSFLPIDNHGYAQAPYQDITEEEWQKSVDTVSPLDWDTLYAGAAPDAEGERYCSNDACELPPIPSEELVPA